MDKATKKILKTAWRNYRYLISILIITAINVWEYETEGYAWVYSHRFFGEEARTIVWLPFVGSIGFLVFYTIVLLTRIRSGEERQHYEQELPEEAKNLICVKCGEVFAEEPPEKIVSCPYCGNPEIEELEGFFERHPDKKDQPSFTPNSDSRNKPKPLHMEMP